MEFLEFHVVGLFQLVKSVRQVRSFLCKTEVNIPKYRDLPTRKMTDLSTAYQRKTHREHILSLPDTYIGSIESAEDDVYRLTETGLEPTRMQAKPGS